MKKNIYLIGSIFLVGVALFLRLYHLPNRAPFDWDQNRDYQAIEAISRGKATLIGPVAKGEGGFFLGPLYYYLATPAFIVSGGNPLSLPLTSVLLDVLAITAILMLLPRLWSRAGSFALATIWTFSFFAIEMSKISWNVALLPLYSVLLIYFSTISTRTTYHNLVFGLILGLSWHIHASLIPLIPLLVLGLILLRHLKVIDLPYIFVGYLFALAPLILFDLRHNFLNLHLLTNFAQASVGQSADPVSLLTSVLSRYGKNIYSTLFVKSDLHFWWGVGFTTLVSLSLIKGAPPAKISALIILLNLLLVIVLREVGFAEYYLGISYLPSILIMLDLLVRLKLPRFVLPILVFILSGYVCLREYTTDPTSYSLGQKQAIVTAIAQRSSSADLRFDLPFGRDTAFFLLLPRTGVVLDPSSKTKVIVSEKMSERLFIDGEITEDLGYFGGMHVGIRVLQ